VVPRVPNAIRTLIDIACRARAIELNIVAEVDAVQTLLHLALDGQGYAVVPRTAIGKPVPADIGISLIESPRIRNNLVLAFSKQRPLSRLGEATCDLLRKQDIGALLSSSIGK